MELPKTSDVDQSISIRSTSISNVVVGHGNIGVSRFDMLRLLFGCLQARRHFSYCGIPTIPWTYYFILERFGKNFLLEYVIQPLCESYYCAFQVTKFLSSDLLGFHRKSSNNWDNKFILRNLHRNSIHPYNVPCLLIVTLKLIDDRGTSDRSSNKYRDHQMC